MSINIHTLNSENFGDGVNKKFWELITNKNIINNINKEHYLTTGSILCLANNNSIILGTGFISEYGDLGGKRFISKSNKKYALPKKILCVRGPLTRNKLLKFGLECPEKYADPLIIFPTLYNPKKNVEKNIIGIIPHGRDYNHENVEILEKNLLKKNYIVKKINICVGDNYKKFIDEINECKYIISSSLHGVIFGLIYNKITCYLRFSDNVIGNGFKFFDFFESLNYKFDYKEYYDERILTNSVNIDYNNLVNLGINFINTIPFIDKNQKEMLIKKYKNYYEL
jgi:pyruvyltransferase